MEYLHFIVPTTDTHSKDKYYKSNPD